MTFFTMDSSFMTKAKQEILNVIDFKVKKIQSDPPMLSRVKTAKRILINSKTKIALGGTPAGQDTDEQAGGAFRAARSFLITTHATMPFEDFWKITVRFVLPCTAHAWGDVSGDSAI